MLGWSVTAQTFTVLHDFAGDGDGVLENGLIVSSNILYGTTAARVFRLNKDGTSFTTLYDFGDGRDGDWLSGVILSGNSLYGTAAVGGSYGGIPGNGTVFKVNTDGTGFTNLHIFTYLFSGTNGDGANPRSGLILSGNTLYGTARTGGNSGNGTVFAINPDGTGFRTLYSFTAGSGSYYTSITNNDGAYPNALILSDNTFYGTASGGGSYGSGTIFSVHTDGSGFITLHSFTPAMLFTNTGNVYTTNSDGAGPEPSAALTLLGNTLYGTAAFGGSSAVGTVFKLNTDGTGFATLHSFAGYPIDGAYPLGGLIISSSSNILYGTTAGGGSSAAGTVFALNTDGTGYTVLHSFIGGTNYGPWSGLTLSGNTLYGTTDDGGSSRRGTVFSLSVTPQLNLVPSGPNMILSWPTNYAGFDYTGYTLQSTTNLASPIWTTNLPAPVVIDGQHTVTNPVSGTQQFFRLSR